MSNVDKDLYNKLRERDGDKCFICGRRNVPLHIDFWIPRPNGGTSDFTNLRLLCAEDSARKSNKFINEREFVHFIEMLLEKSENYRETISDAKLPESRYRGDILSARRVGDSWEQILIEVKIFSTFTSPKIKEIIHQLKTYKQFAKDCKLILAFPGLLPAKDVAKIESEGIEVWDINYISETFATEISSFPHLFFQFLFPDRQYVEKHDQLILDLIAIPTGREDNVWVRYQRHVGEILDYLFSQALSSKITEHSDHFRINRRDFILRNYAESGFWAQIRNRYLADFIVLDAKNSGKLVTKKEVLQIGNYLKEHGVGLFGIIVSRKGENQSCHLTRREIWAMDKKMVIVLDDEDMKRMIIAKATSNNPEEIIRQKIEEFRLSM